VQISKDQRVQVLTLRVNVGLLLFVGLNLYYFLHVLFNSLAHASYVFILNFIQIRYLCRVSSSILLSLSRLVLP